jgi:hypothetical protein
MSEHTSTTNPAAAAAADANSEVCALVDSFTIDVGVGAGGKHIYGKFVRLEDHEKVTNELAAERKRADDANANLASVCEQSARLQRELDAAYKRAEVAEAALQWMSHESNWMGAEEAVVKRRELAGKQVGTILFSWGVKPWIFAKEAMK